MPSTSAMLMGALPLLMQVAAQTPLVDRRFPWGSLPYKADTDTGVRGSQFGYNLCNSTTQNQDSACQTAVINSIDDFCLWAPPEPNSVVGDTEGEMVAWCTKSGYGTRIIPAGALTAVQFIRTPEYVQVTGRMNQALINIQAGDTGGEMDPHGADRRGNPLGGLLYSQRFGGSNGTFSQVIEWHNFMGGDIFCLKACDPNSANGPSLCEHIFDRIGCAYNAPAAYEPDVFESCEGDTQLPPGIYVGPDNVTSTYTQPPESLGAISTLPYVAVIPASSQCTQYTSSSIYTDGGSLASSASASASRASASSASAASSASRMSASVSGLSSGTRASTSAAPTGNSATSGASRNVAVGGLTVIFAVVVGLLA